MEMQSGTVLNPGDGVHSANGRYRFVYQTDGNLVLYGPGGALWNSQTDGSPAGACTMQTDGNLVVYAPGEEPIWASATDNNAGARLIMQDDGNAVIYRTDGSAVWATGTQEDR